MAVRALEIGAAVAVARSKGLSVAFMTFTMRHNKRQGLGYLWDGLAKAWKRVTTGKGWLLNQGTARIVGYLRVVEVTYGENGWHVHVHVLVFSEQLGADSLMDLGTSMWGRWSGGLRAHGLAAPLPVGSEWHLVGGDLSGTKLGQYLAKGVGAAGAIGMELTQTQSKVAQGVHKTKPVWQLLDDGAIDGEVGPLRMWHEWEKASKGRRQIAWSRGLRVLLGLGPVEKSDEEIAAEELGSGEDTLVWITRSGWGELVRRPELIPEVLNVAEGVPAQLSEWLQSIGVEHLRA